ncbi:diguanylate cyclase [Azospirillum sp. ST 5-10]|uniref:diguanylate cyclase n=1 Tax=unclassified Azospirillum TaxID=2630922 RepID=UPI003F4A0C05
MSESDSPQSCVEGLGLVLDEHLRWVGQWHRAAFYRRGRGGDHAAAPAAFARWCAAVRKEDLTHQPAIEKLVTVHEQMHRQARLVLLKAANGEPPSEAEYESVIGRFEEFAKLLRRMERAFGAAASGLDPLTGLRSRRGMQEALEREMNRFRRTGQPFCLALCDIDRFKSVNDTYGHDVGDRVLAAMAAVVSRSIRSFDEAFRMGGEEFLVCLKETVLEDGWQVVERLRADLMATPIVLPDGRVLRITASFGLVESGPDTAVDDLVVRADRALYHAKNSGRNRVVRYGLDMPDAGAAATSPA